MTTEQWIEAVATGTGFLAVYLLTRGDGRGWSLGVVNVLLLAAVYWQDNLQASTGLQFIFLTFQLVGWWRWRKSDKQDLRQTSRRLSLLQKGLALSALLALWGGIWLLVTHTGGGEPLLDSFATAASIVAQILMVWSFAENWLVWLSTNVIYIYLNYSTDSWFLMFLYLSFLVLSIQGWMQWTREERAKDRTDPV